MQLQLPKMDGMEVEPGVWLIGEPTPMPGTTKMRCLANVGGALCLIELGFKFGDPDGQCASQKQED